MLRSTFLVLPLLIICGCDLLSGESQTAEDHSLFPLQLAIEGYNLPAGSNQDGAVTSADGHEPADAHQSETAAAHALAPSVAVLSVVDSSALNAENEEAEEGAQAEALRRERVVRQAISSALVANSLIDVMQPDQDSTDKARAEIIANNSAALSAPLASELGVVIGADILVCALIDRRGADVNIVAQNAHDGKLVYQDTLKDWEVVVGSLAEPEE